MFWFEYAQIRNITILYYYRVLSTVKMIWFASSIAFVAWDLVKAFDGRCPPSRYLILWSPRVRFCNSVAWHRKPSGHDRARMERFSEKNTFLESSLYCHAMMAFSAAFKKWRICLLKYRHLTEAFLCYFRYLKCMIGIVEFWCFIWNNTDSSLKI